MKQARVCAAAASRLLAKEGQRRKRVHSRDATVMDTVVLVTAPGPSCFLHLTVVSAGVKGKANINGYVLCKRQGLQALRCHLEASDVEAPLACVLFGCVATVGAATLPLLAPPPPPPLLLETLPHDQPSRDG